MKRTMNILALSLLLIMAVPLVVTGGSSHGTSHSTTAQKNIIGTVTVDGVDAVAELNDVREAMALAGQTATHHLQVTFRDLDTKRTIKSGMAAVKVIPPGGGEFGPSEMLGMDGHFGADLQLTQKGIHTFSIGTRLEDGNTRQYVFNAEVK